MNKELIIRLAKYKRLLQKFKALGLERVFSNNLGDAIDVTPALVRKDFSALDLPGNKRGGYNIDEILERLNRHLGSEKVKEVIIVGCGKIGSALLEYNGFKTMGIRITAGFDIVPEKVSTASDVPVYQIDRMPQFVQDHGIKVGVIAVPENSANEVLERMIEAGISGILNFAPVELKCPKDCMPKDCIEDDCQVKCTIHNLNIGSEIENLFYLINIKDKKVTTE